MLLKAKYLYRYPLKSPADRTQIQVSYDQIKAGTTAQLETKTKTLSLTRYYSDDKIIYEADEDVEFYSNSLGEEIPRDGLVGEWLFWEGSGTTLHDSSPYGNHGTIYGMTWETLSTGKIVGSFDGVDDYIGVPDSASLNVDYELTVMAWFNCVDITLDQKILNKYTTSGGYMFGITNSALRLEIRDSNGIYYSYNIGVLPSSNVWIFGAMVVKINDKVKAYVNGILKSQEKAPTTKIGTNTQPLYIARFWSSLTFMFKGKIGLIRIYNRALSDSEIKTIYEQEKSLFGL